MMCLIVKSDCNNDRGFMFQGKTLFVSHTHLGLSKAVHLNIAQLSNLIWLLNTIIAISIKELPENIYFYE